MAEPTEAPVALEAVSEEPKTVEDLNKLITTANLAYSQKHWEAAVEAYSEAAQVQDMINGEMAPENAELLYLYGRCLYKVGVSKSAVLGGQAVSEKTNIKKLDQDKDTLKPVGESVVQIDVEEEEEEEEEEEAEEDDDDFGTAYEILDMARVLFEKQLEAQKSVVSDESGDSKGKGSASQEMSPQVRHLIERLADTHDWQAEIALENERFDDAADESRSMLKYRQQIYSEDSRLVSEAHFKLALALEFTFFTAVREAKEAEAMQLGQSKENKDTLDPKVLHEAIEELVRAIQSCESRLEKDVAKSSELSGDDAKKNEADITDQKEIIHDMLAKLSDLANAVTAMSAGKKISDLFDSSITDVIQRASKVEPQPENLASVPGLQEVSGTAAMKPGETEAQRQERIKEATATANDLSGLVRKKKPAETNGSASAGATNGKRKLDDSEVDGGEGKKVKVDAEA